MTEQCLTCIQSKNYEKLEQRQATLEEMGRKRDAAIADIRVDTAVTKEKTASIADDMKEVKDSVRDIHSSVKGLETKPSERWETVIKTLITVIITSGITFVIARLASASQK